MTGDVQLVPDEEGREIWALVTGSGCSACCAHAGDNKGDTGDPDD